MDKRLFITILAGLAVVAAIFGVVGASISPLNFPGQTVVNIAPGTTLSQTADLLESKGLIKSTWMYKIYAVLIDGGTRGVKSGQYLFDSPQSVLRIAYRTTHGLEGFPLVKVTIPEGSSSVDIAKLIKKSIPGFDSDTFITIAKKDEGYLFPDTYFWPTNVTPNKVVTDMQTIFQNKLATINDVIGHFDQPLSQVIKMASIVEKEATSSTDRRIVAGILWHRLTSGMALQVDPPFAYFLNKPLDQLTLDDLKTASPYNLYLHTGLPPTPIDNPGLDAILDTVQPTNTPYWFYLSGKDGVMHYATTLEGHNANKAKYLNL